MSGVCMEGYYTSPPSSRNFIVKTKENRSSYNAKAAVHPVTAHRIKDSGHPCFSVEVSHKDKKAKG